MPVKIRDKGLNRLRASLGDWAKGHTLTVGVHSTEGAQTAKGAGATVADIATINEFGLGVPERSFIRDWFDLYIDKNRALLQSIGVGVVAGKYSVETGLGRAGAFFVGSIQARIATSIPPPNAPSTIKQKGSAVTLVDTGQLRSSILWKVTRDG